MSVGTIDGEQRGPKLTQSSDKFIVLMKVPTVTRKSVALACMHACMHEVGENCKIAHDNVTTTTCMHLGICASIGVLESGQVLAWGSLELRRWENGDCGNLQDVVGTDS